MIRLVALLAVVGFIGMTMILSELRWFRRPSTTRRLAPYTFGRIRLPGPSLVSVASVHEVVAPLSRALGERISKVFGVGEELGVRLRRIHSPLDVTTFRIRQLGWSTAALGVCGLFVTLLGVPAHVAMLFVIGGPILVFLLLEFQVVSASAKWQRRVCLELPVVAEQIGMLTSAGWSLGASVGRIASRGVGACSADLKRVVGRMHQGLSEVEALREWGEQADVDALHRLVSVLALNREAADLGRLVSNEARSIRREAQRELIETIERRSQQVWIPVTVATLVPGVLLMGTPFIDALTLFGV